MTTFIVLLLFLERPDLHGHLVLHPHRRVSPLHPSHRVRRMLLLLQDLGAVQAPLFMQVASA